MSTTYWSASRVGCHAQCPLRFKLHYVEHWAPKTPISNDEAARKGSTFHETVEQYETGMTREELWSILLKKAEELKIDVKKLQFPDKEDEFYKTYTYEKAYTKGIDKFLLFWKTFIEPAEKSGYAIHKESWFSGEINKEKFRGALDLLVEGENDCTIYDYKTKSYADVGDYKNQLMLYAYLVGSNKGWDYEQIAEKIKLKVFFPLAIDKKGKAFVDLPIEESMMKSLVEIKYTAEDLRKVINDFYCLEIGKIHRTDWTKPIEGVISHGCSYCQYLSAPPDEKIGFPGCPATIAAEILQPVPGIEYVKEDWNKKTK